MLTTLQALDLSNSPQFAETLAQGAPKLLKRFAGRDSSAIVDWLYESALSRPATGDERTISIELLGSPPTPQGMEDLLWVVVMLPEFQIIR
jgi:hypothetical protein